MKVTLPVVCPLKEQDALSSTLCLHTLAVPTLIIAHQGFLSNFLSHEFQALVTLQIKKRGAEWKPRC